MAIPAVQLLADRSLEQTQAFIKAVTKTTCLTPGSSPESGHIIIQDVKRDDWATGRQTMVRSRLIVAAAKKKKGKSPK